MEESTFLNPAKTLEAAGVRAGMRVADLGAGSGFFTRAAARLVGEDAMGSPSTSHSTQRVSDSMSSGSSRGMVWAVDVHHELLPRIKNLSLAEGLQNVEVMHGDAERLHGTNLPDSHFDFVICTNLLFGVEHKKILVDEIKRILKPNARVLVVDWQGSYGGLGPHPEHVVTEAAARDLFEAGHFVFVERVPAGEYHWGLSMRKG